jgi:8-oxo-dGTP diphosphatase
MSTSRSTPSIAAESAVHVAAAVVCDGDAVLVAKRPPAVHQGGKWEFPGGKVHTGESARAALARELREELDICVQAAHPLIKVHHAYPDKSVCLDVWRVTAYTGKPHGREGQRVEWVESERLPELDFPEANKPIVQAARLPSLYLISDSRRFGESVFLQHLEDVLTAGVRLLQLREPHLAPADYQTLARRVAQRCHRRGAKLLLNADPAWVEECGADGVHLNSRRLRGLHARPLNRRYWVAASTHNAAELELAAQLDVDFVVLGPVLPTPSHSQVAPLGWEQFAALCAATNLPTYALGGQRVEHLSMAREAGAQGLAMISGVWDMPNPRAVIEALR